MSIIGMQYEYIVGVDTHTRSHTFTIVQTSTGAVLCTSQFPTTTVGMTRALSWITRRTTGGRTFAAVEGTSSYGARLTKLLVQAGLEIGEVRPPSRASRAMTGKSDAEGDTPIVVKCWFWVVRPAMLGSGSGSGSGCGSGCEVVVAGDAFLDAGDSG